MHSRVSLLLAGAALGTLPTGANATDVIFAVGPTGQYQRISDAVAMADADTDPSNYYVIQVAPGTYVNDFSEVTRPMTIEVDPNQAGQGVVIAATIPPPNQKGLILATASYDPNCVPVQLADNIFQGVATPVNPSACAVYQQAAPSTAPPSTPTRRRSR